MDKSTFRFEAAQKKTRQTGTMIILGLLFACNEVLATEVTIYQFGNTVRLSWPLDSTQDYYLQKTTNLSPPIAWMNERDPITNGNTLVIKNQMQDLANFYRLQGWEVLFDGTNTTGLRASSGNYFPSNSWCVTNGTLASKVVANPTDLVTANTYTNFELRLIWKCGTNGNSGIFYRSAGIPEYQLFDDANVATSHYTDQTYAKPVNLMGAVYGYIAPTNKILAPTGQWNDCRVIVQGYHAMHWLNGRLIVDYQINNPAYTNAFTQLTNTGIGFQNKGNGDHGVVPGAGYFGYIKIRRLP